MPSTKIKWHPDGNIFDFKSFFMNRTTKILTAFTVATIAGTVLGMLLISSEDSKSKKLIDENKKEGSSFIDKFFRHKKDRDVKEDLKQQVEQNAGEYEQA